MIEKNSNYATSCHRNGQFFTELDFVWAKDFSKDNWTLWNISKERDTSIAVAMAGELAGRFITPVKQAVKSYKGKLLIMNIEHSCDSIESAKKNAMASVIYNLNEDMKAIGMAACGEDVGF